MVQPTQTDPQFKLRLPAELKERISTAAETKNRSMNAEIVSALEEAFPPPDKDVMEILSELRSIKDDMNYLDFDDVSDLKDSIGNLETDLLLLEKLLRRKFSRS